MNLFKDFPVQRPSTKCKIAMDNLNAFVEGLKIKQKVDKENKKLLELINNKELVK